MRIKSPVLPMVVFIMTLFASTSIISSEPDNTFELRGQYLVEIGGCNDCHTSGFASSGGITPEDQRLLGDSLGYRGPWGTTYAINLREYISQITEDEWVEKAKVLRTRPPMPWWSVNAMTENDLRAVYRYIKSLGTITNEVPPYLPPTQTPDTPYIQWPSPPE